MVSRGCGCWRRSCKSITRFVTGGDVANSTSRHNRYAVSARSMRNLGIPQAGRQGEDPRASESCHITPCAVLRALEGKQGYKETEMSQEGPRLFLQETQVLKLKLCRESNSQYTHGKLSNTLKDTFVQAPTLESSVVDPENSPCRDQTIRLTRTDTPYSIS